MEKKKFYVCSNNGVTAVVTEQTHKDLQKYCAIGSWFDETDAEKLYEERRLRRTAISSALGHLCTPTFTFTRPERASVSPWFTGDSELFWALTKHVENNGGVLLDGSCYVPFSNGSEVGLHGHEALKDELSYVTTEQQFQETFGISISELINKK
ncbi:MAG: hypothetical protein WC694_01245 [Candidatus Paceibacterota bacterium]|jgi:hypothetical protein